MREVLRRADAVVAAGETVGVGTVVATLRVRAAPARRLDARRPGRRGRRLASPAAASRAPSTSSPRRSSSPARPCCSATASATTTRSPSGLTCGGILDVFVEKVDRETFPELGEVAADIEAGRPVAVATVIEHPDPSWVGRRSSCAPEVDEATERAEHGGAPRGSASVLGSLGADARTTPSATTRGASRAGHARHPHLRSRRGAAR